MKQNTFKINKNDVALALFFLAGAFRWFYSGIAGGINLQILFLAGAVLFCLSSLKLKIDRLSCVWMIYVISLSFNVVLRHLFGGAILKNLLVVILIVLFSIVYSGNLNSFYKTFKALAIYGVINAIFVMIHYVMGDSFIDFYSKFLSEDGIAVADNYAQLGHYFGFNYLPTDTAGLITFSMTALILLKFFIKRKKSISSYIPCLLIIPLLLTGKKGILFLTVIAFALTVLLIYASKNQWIKMFKFIIIGTIVVFGCYYFIVTHQDIDLFRRLNDFFASLSTGKDYDSNRYGIWEYALVAWSNHKLFGIGWRQFVSITTLIYGSGHEVNCDYLQILCETGIVGAGLTLIPLVVMLHRTVVTCKYAVKYMDEQNEKWIVLCSCFFQIFILMYAVIEIPFYDMTFFSIYILTAMVVNRCYASVRKVKQEDQWGYRLEKTNIIY